MTEPSPLLDALAAHANLTLSVRQHQLLTGYLDLLLDANRRMNLTRITDRAAAEVQHLGDAFTLLPYLPSGPIELVDVGSGGGVPGIPLAIARPEMTVVLIESTKKKAAFLREAAMELRLSNVTLIDQRAEDVAQVGSPWREHLDVAVCRAVATMNWLGEWCLPLVRKGGKMLAMKGPKVSAELPAAARAIRLVGGGEPVIHPVALPGTEHRVIVEVPKVRATDPKYPRGSTTAKGKPL